MNNISFMLSINALLTTTTRKWKIYRESMIIHFQKYWSCFYCFLSHKKIGNNVANETNKTLMVRRNVMNRTNISQTMSYCDSWRGYFSINCDVKATSLIIIIWCIKSFEGCSITIFIWWQQINHISRWNYSKIT